MHGLHPANGTPFNRHPSPRLSAAAAAGLKIGQLVSAAPGLMAISRKRRLVPTLRAAYGERANTIVPLSFALPNELPQFEAHLAACSAEGRDAGLWMLKTSQHLGKGLTLLPPDQVLAEARAERCAGCAGAARELRQLPLRCTGFPRGAGCLRRVLPAGLRRSTVPCRTLPDAASLALQQMHSLCCNGYESAPASTLTLARCAAARRPAPLKPYVCAQQYVANPLLIGGRKFGIRVWVLVTGFDPLRAYIHGNGLVLFANNEYDGASWASDDGTPARGHVTNYAQNMDGWVWSLEQLKGHLGADAFASLWGRIEESSALAVAACLGEMQQQHSALKIPYNSTFEVRPR